MLLSLHHISKYHGLSMEDPNKHLKEFEVVCSSMTPVNVDNNILKMKAFPFSLLEKVIGAYLGDLVGLFLCIYVVIS